MEQAWSLILHSHIHTYSHDSSPSSSPPTQSSSKHSSFHLFLSYCKLPPPSSLCLSLSPSISLPSSQAITHRPDAGSLNIWKMTNLEMKAHNGNASLSTHGNFRMGLLLGNESHGVTIDKIQNGNSSEFGSHVQFPRSVHPFGVTIGAPNNSLCDSLNVASAAAILLRDLSIQSAEASVSLLSKGT